MLSNVQSRFKEASLYITRLEDYDFSSYYFDLDVTIEVDSNSTCRQIKALCGAFRKVYLLLYKPKGVITSHGDPQGRRTVYDLLGESGRWVFPVGRLDLDTSGLLLMTNDTKFADFIASPESGISKTYLVKASGLLSDEVISQLNAGVQMKRGDWAHPEKVRRLEDRGKYTQLEVTLTEGKNREVRRMLEAVGFVVLKLVRTHIGPLTLAGLEVGKWRELSAAEVAMLRSCRSRPAMPRS